MSFLRRAILHIDCNCFFVSCERLRDPTLKEKAVIVGGTGTRGDRRGVVTSASYEARDKGVQAGMSLFKAKKLCPEAIVVPVDGGWYQEVSDKLIRVLKQFTDKVEVASIDEAYVDITDQDKVWGDSYLALLVQIEQAIANIVRVPVSIGLADNKVTAKIAASCRKPGITIVPSTITREFLGRFNLDAFPGLGSKTVKQLQDLGMRTIADLQWWTYQEIRDFFGAFGEYLYLAINGYDDRQVLTESNKPLSISREHTFAYDHDFASAQIMTTLRLLTAHVLWRMRRQSLHAREVRLKVRLDDFSTFTKTCVLPEFSASDQEIMPTVRHLFWQLRKSSKGKRVRLIGVGVGKLEEIESQSLFVSSKAKQLQSALDELADRYHRPAVLLGA